MRIEKRLAVEFDDPGDQAAVRIVGRSGRVSTQRRVPAAPDESPAMAAERARRFATIKDLLTAETLGKY